MSSARQYLRKLDDDFLAGGPLARGVRVAAAIAVAVVIGGVVGLFAAVPLTELLLRPAPSDYSVVAIPFGTTAVGALGGGLGMALWMLRRKRR